MYCPSNYFDKCVVLTGGPCSGKSTTLSELEKMSFQTCPEAATHYLEEQKQRGFTPETLQNDRVSLERAIMRTAILNEAQIDTSQWCFLDRSTVDLIAYCEEGNIDPIPYLTYAALRRYHQKVFFFERFPLLDDRMEKDEKEAANVERLLFQIYQKLGYSLIMVPIMDVQDRVRFILDQIKIQ